MHLKKKSQEWGLEQVLDGSWGCGKKFRVKVLVCITESKLKYQNKICSQISGRFLFLEDYFSHWGVLLFTELQKLLLASCISKYSHGTILCARCI